MKKGYRELREFKTQKEKDWCTQQREMGAGGSDCTKEEDLCEGLSPGRVSVRLKEKHEPQGGGGGGRVFSDEHMSVVK